MMKNLTKHPIKKLLAVVTFIGAASTSVIAAPRTLANGAPAPGNTVAKGYVDKQTVNVRRMDQAKKALAAALVEQKAAKAALASQPRTLPNGAPACGNTGGKAPECTAEMAQSMYEARIQRARAAETMVQVARKKLHEATREVAMQNLDGGSAVDDYS
jgi:hypothetical protein